jgi:hypothetical protein
MKTQVTMPNELEIRLERVLDVPATSSTASGPTRS